MRVLCGFLGNYGVFWRVFLELWENGGVCGGSHFPGGILPGCGHVSDAGWGILGDGVGNVKGLRVVQLHV
ncbi:MAG: hypothetical protein IBGAMO2_150021 [Arenicellales bacterium IbO2]|nr:MAG: hypothetical protein IBGAMO2_150021 [Arenicellales bacterium IbO2]